VGHEESRARSIAGLAAIAVNGKDSTNRVGGRASHGSRIPGLVDE